MKKLLVASLFAVGFVVPAAANDTADQCRAYVAENGGDDTGCECLGAAADADASLAASISKIETPADLEVADQATKDAIAACFPSA